MKVKDVESIKILFEQLKKDRKILNWHEFAAKVGYDRTYISRVLNGHEALSQDLVDKINNTTFYVNGNVPKSNIDYKDEYIKLLKEHVELLKSKKEPVTLEELKDIIEKSSKGLHLTVGAAQAILTVMYDALVKDSEKDRILGEKLKEIQRMATK